MLTTLSPVQRIVDRCTQLFEDLDFTAVKEWKAAKPGRKAIGYLPIYVPREIIHAAGMLPVGIFGGGDQLEVIQGDAYYQSYICRIPRSTIELGLTGRLDCMDGMLFPSICDVIRNLSGMWQILFPDKYVKYIDVPQNYVDSIGGNFYIHEMQTLRDDLGKLRGKPITDDELNASIAVYNDNRLAIDELWLVSPESAKLLELKNQEVELASRVTVRLTEWTKNKETGEIAIEASGVRMAMNRGSAQRGEGLVIDFVEGPSGGTRAVVELVRKVARSERAHRRLQRMLRDRLIERHYTVLVHGRTPPALTVDRPIGRHPTERKLMSVSVGSDGFTDVGKSGDSKVIYVSSSAGSDSNGGLTADSPVKSISKGMSLMRSGSPDHLLDRKSVV